MNVRIKSVVKTDGGSLVTVDFGHAEKTELIPSGMEDLDRRFSRLARASKYVSGFDTDVYLKLARRFGAEQPSGGVIFKSPLSFRGGDIVWNSYGRGCVHNVAYCPERASLAARGMWNRPFPMPADITQLWSVLYTVFETDRPSPYRAHLEAGGGITLGGYNDPFAFMDMKYGITREALRMLNHYGVPYTLRTRSDLVSRDDYAGLLDPRLCTVEMLFSTADNDVACAIEPGAPSPARRHRAAFQLREAGIKVVVVAVSLAPEFDWMLTKPHIACDKTEHWPVGESILSRMREMLTPEKRRLSGAPGEGRQS